MAISKWLQRRDWSNEAALFDREMDEQTKKVDAQFPKIGHATRYALAFKALADQSKAIPLFIRYATAHQRAYHKAMETFLKLRAKLPPSPPPEPNQEVSEAQPLEEDFCETNPAKNENPAPEAATNEETTSNADQNPKNGDPEL